MRDNITMNSEEVACEGVDWLLLDEVRMQRWAPENTAMKQ
jgi:hypothetical protein